MKTKHIKITYSSQYSRSTGAPNPKIQMEGRWLEELGFTIGSHLVVEYEHGSIHIRLLTAEKTAAAEQETLKKEIDRRRRELEAIQRQLKNPHEIPAMVAEPKSGYRSKRNSAHHKEN